MVREELASSLGHQPIPTVGGESAAIGRVQDAGLVCISWGELNDVPENVEKQAVAGLDAIHHQQC